METETARERRLLVQDTDVMRPQAASESQPRTL